MKAKIFEALKREYSSLGLGDEILQSQAGMLANLGFVTDENLQQVVSAQKENLAILQRQNDSRVNSAIEKALKKAEEAREAKEKAAREAAEKAAAEEAERKRAEQEKEAAEKAREAKEKADKEAAEKAAAEEAARLAELAKNGEIPEWYRQKESEALQRAAETRKRHEEEVAGYKAVIEEIRKSQAEAQKQFSEAVAALTGKNSDLQNAYDAIRKEADDAKAAKARADRMAFISAKATELGIPEWRQAEGFGIADDADDATVEGMLSTIAANVKAHQIPASASPFPLAGGSAGEGIDISGIADMVVNASI